MISAGRSATAARSATSSTGWADRMPSKIRSSPSRSAFLRSRPPPWRSRRHCGSTRRRTRCGVRRCWPGLSAGSVRAASTYIVIAIAGTTVAMLGAGVVAGLTYGIASGDVSGKLPTVLAVAALQLPAIWMLSAITVALFGLVPRFTPGRVGCPRRVHRVVSARVDRRAAALADQPATVHARAADTRSTVRCRTGDLAAADRRGAAGHRVVGLPPARSSLASIPGAEIVLRLFWRGGWLSGWEGELEGSVVPPGYWGFEVGVAGVDELGVVAA